VDTAAQALPPDLCHRQTAEGLHCQAQLLPTAPLHRSPQRNTAHQECRSPAVEVCMGSCNLPHHQAPHQMVSLHRPHFVILIGVRVDSIRVFHPVVESRITPVISKIWNSWEGNILELFSWSHFPCKSFRVQGPNPCSPKALFDVLTS
jgi:hypothetical protein